jgi:hypothetical protein
MACDAVSLGEWFVMFQRIVMVSSSRVKESKKNASIALPLKMKATQSFEMLGTTHSVTAAHPR